MLAGANRNARFIGIARDSKGWMLGLWWWIFLSKRVAEQYEVKDKE